MRRHLSALAACAAVVLAAWCALTPPRPPEPTYALLAIKADGNVYVLDYGMTLEDCRRSEQGAGYPATICEAEG